MMDLTSLVLFRQIARQGGLAAAARAIGLSPASASARLAALEAELGARLFHRTTRSVRLTTDGEAFLPHVAAALSALEDGRAAIRPAGALSGRIRLAAPGSFARLHLMPLLAGFARQNPAVRLELGLSDDIEDLVGGGYDLAIRNAALPSSGLVARRLAPDARLLVASPAYLAEAGAPAMPADLARHRTVAVGARIALAFEAGPTLRMDPAFRANDGEAARMAAEAGLGIALMSLWNAQPALAAGRLVPVLPAHPLRTEEAIWAVLPAGRQVPARVRALLALLVSRFSPRPPWEGA